MKKKNKVFICFFFNFDCGMCVREITEGGRQGVLAENTDRSPGRRREFVVPINS